MYRRDWTDIIGGLLLLVFGVWFLWHAQTYYNLGEMRRMGPGAFPAGLGVLMAIFGLLIMIPAWFRPGDLPVPAIRPLICIIGGGLGFALVVEPYGLVPATFAVVCISALAERELRPVRTFILAVALAIMAVTVFSKGLGIPVPAFRWGSY
ncbi:tripartite tricarboxylate transporter TctB family protein [Falsiroseomonas sp.]|uniref:tripartite tricarboxylate transporter TctB family protein n=1 Tax=Falsiroseomonas sp. TaxID=2870721 RepID=UPI00271D57A1|nr:tripartite tricarboxylate transporter TctB family protein [Falsiroseomonas sp.]MDO9501625.1 tripartite tricarboxylate transporter TctB family protein [Falsiroseomonas sp.]MDP3419181.1 tripartite tricarboxylate transporter TctB family protein [Falsiroseomonas sp.]